MSKEPTIPLSELETVVGHLVKQQLAKMLGVDKQSDRPEALPIAEAFSLLGYPSAQAIYKDITAGLLRVGHEVEDRRRPGAKTPRYYIDIEATRKRLKTDPSKRRAT